MTPGDKFDLLEALYPVAGGKYWMCRCKCGKETKVSRWHFEKGLRRSCGCRKREPADLIVCTKCNTPKERKEFYVRRSGVLSARVCRECAIINSCTMSILRQQRLKKDALNHYSNGSPKCDCCGEANLEFLAIDHINGGGNQHRKRNKINNLYRWLKKNDYPEGFRVLCHNCNFSYGAYGYCPHKGKCVGVFRGVAAGSTVPPELLEALMQDAGRLVRQ